MEDSIFTKIIRGEIPCHKVYEDDLTLVFLDIYPLTEGYTIVIPKKQVEFVWDLDDATYVALMSTTKKVALRLREVLGTKYVGEIIEGVDVPHAHVKLAPFNNAQELKNEQNTNSEPDHSSLAELADKLAF
ncbi:MAG: HIT domain-containing protein [Candidatus Saccharimonadales bacterium]